MIPFIATYSPSAVPLIKVIKDNFNHFRDKTQLLQDHRIIAAYRKKKNLRDHLVKANVKALSNSRSKGHGEFFRTNYGFEITTTTMFFLFTGMEVFTPRTVCT